MQRLKLSVTDQSPIHDASRPSQAPLDTVRLAMACDRLGYHRYWIAEHHSTPGYASPCPEIVIAHVAQNTKRIRVGSGGVMMTHYSPFKVAETFRMLETFHPGRIDLGLGRAPGGDRLATMALSYPRNVIDSQHYPHQVHELMNHLYGAMPKDHPFSSLMTVPVDGGSPEIWLLGSSDGSAQIAGQLGAGFALALFIGTHDRPHYIMDMYRNSFQPSPGLQEPHALIAVCCVCAETTEEALKVASTRTMWIYKGMYQGEIMPLPSHAQVEALYAALGEAERAQFHKILDQTVTGTPQECKAKLEALAEKYQVDEISLVTVTYTFAERLKSYELLAEAFGLDRESDNA